MSKSVIALIAALWALSASAQKQARPWLGIAIGDHPKGVLIKQILPETPAEQAGLKKDDVVFAIDDHNTPKAQELIKVIQSKGVGTAVTVHFLRSGKAAQKTIKLVLKPDELDLIKKKMLGQRAPNFDLEVVGDKKAHSGKLSDYRGKVVILEFWATWCPACNAAHRPLEAALKQQQGKLAVLTISNEELPVLQEFHKKRQPSFAVLRDGKDSTRGDWIFSAIPGFAVIDQGGVVRHVSIGAGMYLDETIAKAIELIKKG